MNFISDYKVGADFSKGLQLRVTVPKGKRKRLIYLLSQSDTNPQLVIGQVVFFGRSENSPLPYVKTSSSSLLPSGQVRASIQLEMATTLFGGEKNILFLVANGLISTFVTPFEVTVDCEEIGFTIDSIQCTGTMIHFLAVLSGEPSDV